MTSAVVVTRRFSDAGHREDDGSERSLSNACALQLAIEAACATAPKGSGAWVHEIVAVYSNRAAGLMSMRLLEEAEQVCTEGLQLAGLEHHTTGDDEEAPKIDVERCVLLEKQCYDATKLIFRRCRIREKLGRTAQALEDAAACAAINPASATFRLCLEDLKGPYTRSATSCHGGSSREVSAAGSVSADSLRTVGDDSGAEGTLRKLLTRK